MAIRGIVRLDGEALARGSVILTPLGPRASVAPPVVAYVVNTGPVRGEFALPATQGPTPGRYRVEIRQDAARWVSNARDPVMASMSAKEKDGTLTDDERRQWIAYARKRNLAPSIADQRVFRSRRPDDRSELTVDIESGRENQLDFDVSTR